MFLRLIKPEKHAKVRINEHNTKEKPKFLLLLSNESTKTYSKAFSNPAFNGSTLEKPSCCRTSSPFGL